MVIHQLDLFGNPIIIPVTKEEHTKTSNASKQESIKEDPTPKSLPLFEEGEILLTETEIVEEQPEPESEVVYSDNQIRVKLKAGRPRKSEEEKAAKPKKIPGKRGRASSSEVDIATGLLNIPDDETLNKKMYYKISVVADWFGVNQSLIRYWENQFDILKPRLTRKGDRLFRVEDIKNLQIIYNLLKIKKFSIDGAKDYLKQNKHKVDVHLEVAESLSKIKTFLLDLKSTLGA